jgi:hypothetical protein
MADAIRQFARIAWDRPIAAKKNFDQINLKSEDV